MMIKKRFFSLWMFLTGILLFAQNTIIAQETHRMRIAVVEFELRGDPIEIKDIEKIVPEFLITELQKIKKYEIEERLLLAKVLQEQKLSATGLITEETAVKIGQLFGVEALVSGTIISFENEIIINARIISTTTGEIISSAMVKFTNRKNSKKILKFSPISFAAYLRKNFRRSKKFKK
ncbi:FlgO family outer membrane protein [Thermospira aquatica]|uniref:FlgO domain-containing protein n=1 Tax=Thermospira aquatica TaxID=2828656 RepID=A0AAX3BA32_9SPIR|nr:FlgO family outer membrane protein [Thermospira aquatica]URA09072.1 hypothetical protein KDW03_06070 [Thermospira aquatica]